MITLKTMKKQAYNKWLKKSIHRYAKENIKVGLLKKRNALAIIQERYKKYLPKGMHTPKNDIYHVYNEEGKRVGDLWIIWVKKEKQLYIAEIYIRKRYRRRGYAKAVLLEMETLVKQRDFSMIELSVFSHNTMAKSLYAHCGFMDMYETKMKKI